MSAPTPQRLSLPRIKTGQTVTIEAEGYGDRMAAEEIFALIIVQAMRDGMTGFSLGVDRARGASWMRYRRGSAAGEATSEWPMTPPPLGVYPLLFQVALKYTTLQPGLPLEGQLRLATQDGPMEVRFVAEQLDAFSISWGVPRGL